jgi:LCP family protein required for cell wall assembly
MKNEKASGRAIFSLLLKTALLSGLITLVLLLISAGLLLAFSLGKINRFTQVSGVSLSELRQVLSQGWQAIPIHTASNKNILILGIDTLETRPGSPPLTDTIMIISINLKTGQIGALSLPRDLWSEDYQTKINALYIYGHERNPENPLEFPQAVISEMTGVPIHHSMVVTMENLAELVDIIAGVEIDVEEPFVDTRFPRSDVDVTLISDPELLYETISFAAGPQRMSGEMVLKYVRSRMSEGDQGNDLARANRQQQVIGQLISQLMSPQVLLKQDRAAKLLRYYLDNFERYLELEEMIATGKLLLPHRKTLNFNTTSLSVYPDDEVGVIYNPPRTPAQPQWIYQIRNHEAFREEIAVKLLGINESKDEQPSNTN